MSAAAFISRKSRLSDMLMNFHFHVFDVSIASPIVLSLVYGFNTCTAPEITVKTKEIKEGTFEYPHNVMESASVNEITLSRGAKFFDSDFYDWISGYIAGGFNKRRNLLIVQYSEISTNSVIPGLGNLVPNIFAPLGDLVSRVPARAWLLHSCIPTNYKASDDFDALSPNVSLHHLTIKYRNFEEFNSGV